MLTAELNANAARDQIEASAIAAIAACTPGPRRDFEIQMWARRIAKDPTGTLMMAITGASTDAELAAMVDLGAALRCYDWSVA